MTELKTRSIFIVLISISTPKTVMYKNFWIHCYFIELLDHLKKRPSHSEHFSNFFSKFYGIFMSYVTISHKLIRSSNNKISLRFLSTYPISIISVNVMTTKTLFFPIQKILTLIQRLTQIHLFPFPCIPGDELRKSTTQS